MPPYLVAPATTADLDAVHELLAAAGAQLAVEGFANWIPPYPRERLALDIDSAVVWVVRDDGGTLVATYTLRASPVRPYDPAPWPEPEAPARYLNRLAVHPSRHGRSVGGWCLDYIAASSALEGARAIRCDVLAANLRLCRFYESAGYAARGTRSHSGWDFSGYELLLTAGS